MLPYIEILWHETNPVKCASRVQGGKFLRHMISERGIETNLEKISDIMDMPPPKSIKEVQKLVGRLVALNRFISRSTDKSLHFFKVLCSIAKFERNKTSQEAVDELKKYLVSPPLLMKPRVGGNPRPLPGSFKKCRAVELSEFGIEFHPRPTIKAQVLVDFIVELTYDKASISTPTWSIYVGGSSTFVGSRVGDSLGGEVALATGATKIAVYSDSQLVIN
ncbi:hypothetical protein Sango_2462700 [Sesamum angolense]|uniref:Uncharacterized protein n=1 Tax=Sesamum angolense TaxID=2727404 RepID=A0AAE1W8M0_9LAMI|nr:hypothetical protein Sango_2462700 [Sesamum angolense]